MTSDLVRGEMFAVMVVRIADPNDPDFESRLAEQVARSPAFFANAPVVLDLAQASGLATADAFQALRKLFKRQHMITIGVTNANGTQVRAAMNADLAAFPASAAAGARRLDLTAPPPAAAVQAAKSEPPSGTPAPRFRVITQPVRSGAQIYAKGTDLVILSSVSPGAEVIADGHVHIYGTLRGRAIAGAGGDKDARIFVSKLEAELICVAGHYMVSDLIPREFRGQSVQVSLVDEALTLARQ